MIQRSARTHPLGQVRLLLGLLTLQRTLVELELLLLLRVLQAKLAGL